MTLDLRDHEAALLLKELNGLIDGDRYFLSERIKNLKAIRAKIRPEPARDLPPPPKQYAPPSAAPWRSSAAWPSASQRSPTSAGSGFVLGQSRRCDR
jgi:hypothetical protein